jgi:hypothetical protein
MQVTIQVYVYLVYCLSRLCYRVPDMFRSYKTIIMGMNDQLAFDFMKMVYEIILAAWSKSWTVFSRSNAGIVDSNPTQGMNIGIVCVYSVFMLSSVLVAALRRADPPSKESYQLCIGSRNWKVAKTH